MGISIDFFRTNWFDFTSSIYSNCALSPIRTSQIRTNEFLKPEWKVLWIDLICTIIFGFNTSGSTWPSTTWFKLNAIVVGKRKSSFHRARYCFACSSWISKTSISLQISQSGTNRFCITCNSILTIPISFHTWGSSNPSTTWFICTTITLISGPILIWT